jgi:hypothetical protein
MLQFASASPRPIPFFGPEDPLLDFTGPVGGSHALVVGAKGSALLCALLRRGCLAATSLRPAERPDGRQYDLLIAPGIGSADCLDHLTAQAARALLPTGRLALRVLGRAGSDLVQATLQMLRLHGFTDVQTVMTGGGTLIRAARRPRKIS